jgi:hypothetical protein
LFDPTRVLTHDASQSRQHVNNYTTDVVSCAYILVIWIENKRYRKPETVATLVTQDTRRRQTKHNTTQKTKKMSNADETKHGGENRCSRMVSKFLHRIIMYIFIKIIYRTSSGPCKVQVQHFSLIKKKPERDHGICKLIG